jgi:1-acyl-sn-glycerol-3-phosphate acyltransferase
VNLLNSNPGSLPNDDREGAQVNWYRAFQLFLTPCVHLLTSIEIRGRENIPATGPFIMVPNHQSFIDPTIVGVFCPRQFHTLAKSTQFRGRFMEWVMPRSKAIPTRRYRIDPQAVRVVLRRLAEGEGVCVYPEGERSWDGSIQPFRRGTIRLLLKSGVPIIPCGLVTYDYWPRWSKPRFRGKIRVEYGEAIRWPAMHDREERNRFLPEAAEILRERLARLSAWDPPDAVSTLPEWLHI